MEEIRAQKREKKTKGFLNALIKQGGLAGVCYNSRNDNIVLSLDKREFEKLYTKVGNHIIFNLSTENDKTRKVVVKDVQYEPLRKELIHVDFYEVFDNIALNTKVPIKLLGEAIGIKLGGVLEQRLHSLSIKSLPIHIPELIEVDTTKLEVGDSIYVEDLNLDNNINILAKPKQAICSCSHSRVTKLGAEEEEEEDKAEEPSIVDNKAAV